MGCGSAREGAPRWLVRGRSPQHAEADARPSRQWQPVLPLPSAPEAVGRSAGGLADRPQRFRRRRRSRRGLPSGRGRRPLPELQRGSRRALIGAGAWCDRRCSAGRRTAPGCLGCRLGERGRHGARGCSAALVQATGKLGRYVPPSSPRAAFGRELGAGLAGSCRRICGISSRRLLRSSRATTRGGGRAARALYRPDRRSGACAGGARRARAPTGVRGSRSPGRLDEVGPGSPWSWRLATSSSPDLVVRRIRAERAPSRVDGEDDFAVRVSADKARGCGAVLFPWQGLVDDGLPADSRVAASAYAAALGGLGRQCQAGEESAMKTQTLLRSSSGPLCRQRRSFAGALAVPQARALRRAGGLGPAAACPTPWGCGVLGIPATPFRSALRGPPGCCPCGGFELHLCRSVRRIHVRR